MKRLDYTRDSQQRTRILVYYKSYVGSCENMAAKIAITTFPHLHLVFIVI
jgi:hypothetical protein